MYKAVMEHLQNFENHDLNMHNGNEEILLKKPPKIFKSNKCDQCDFASSWASTLKTHLEMHSVDKSNECNQCKYASSDPSALRSHLKKTQ